VAANSIEEAIVTKILSLTTVTAYIGARIYWMDAPQGTTTYPYIVLGTISAPNEAQSIGQKGGQPLIQVSVWHRNKQNGLDLGNALIEGLDHFSGTVDGYSIKYITATGPTALRDPDYDNLYQYVVNLYPEYDRS
jgi:hypothetical protein